MSDKLPKGWIKTMLGAVARPGRSRVSPREHFGLPYVGLEHIESQTMQRLGQGEARNVRSSSILFEKGDVLYAKMRPYLNKVWVAEFPGICSAEFLVFPYSEELNSAFLAFRLNADDFVNFANQQVSGDRPRVNFKSLSSFTLCLPPLAEQGRIVAKLKESLARIQASVKTAQRAGERLQKYRAAVLHAAVTGELTRKWRKTHQPKETGKQLLQRILKNRRARWEETELQRLCKAGKSPKSDKWKVRYPETTPLRTKHLPPLPKGWTWASLDQLSFVVRGASPRPAGDPRFFGGRVPWITVGALTKDSQPYLMQVAETVTEAGKEASRYVEEDTLLLTNSGATLGVPKISRISGCINDGVAALLQIDYPLKLYLYYFLTGETNRLRDINQGAAQPNLNTRIIRAIIAPIPPFEEQARIVREVDRRLSAADRLAATLNRQLKLARAMRQSLLYAAFAGHLVPQNPKDEPASVLFERILAVQEVEAKKPKVKHMSKAKFKSQTIRRPLIEVLRDHKKPMTPEQLFNEAGFQSSQVDLFYRELVSLRKFLREKKPSASETNTWPHRAQVLLKLKES